MDRVSAAYGTANIRLSSLQSSLLLHESGFDICVTVTHVNKDNHESDEQVLCF
jgi:hypothetical protein